MFVLLPLKDAKMLPTKYSNFCWYIVYFLIGIVAGKRNQSKDTKKEVYYTVEKTGMLFKLWLSLACRSVIMIFFPIEFLRELTPFDNNVKGTTNTTTMRSSLKRPDLWFHVSITRHVNLSKKLPGIFLLFAYHEWHPFKPHFWFRFFWKRSGSSNFKSFNGQATFSIEW